MRRLRIDYTIYSPEYRSGRDSQGRPQDGHGECWDCPTFRSAKRKARELGIGSLVIRNFNQGDRPGRAGEWWQTQFCWVWNGLRFTKAYSVMDKKWVVPDYDWLGHEALRRLRAAKH